MKFFRGFILLCFFSLLAGKTYSQFTEDALIFKDNKFLEKDNVNLSLNGSGFFFNQEYFNKLAYSYTLAGYSLSPMVEYQILDNLRLSLGGYMVKSLGREQFDEIMPAFSLKYKPWKHFLVEFGSFNGGLSHQLPEQMYSYSQALFQSNEEGIRLMYDNKHLFCDVWLDWRSLTYPKDVKTELIFAGYNLSYTFNFEPNIALKLFSQMSIYHDGGQDLIIPHILLTYQNLSVGYHFKYQLNKYASLGNKTSIIQFNNAFPYKQFPFNKGYGVFTEMHGRWKFLSAKVGYWYGNRFYNPLGNFQFSSVSQKYFKIYQTHNQTVYSHLEGKQEIYPGIITGMRYGMYYNFKHKYLDYYLGLFVKYNLNFRLYRSEKQINCF